MEQTTPYRKWKWCLSKNRKQKIQRPLTSTSGDYGIWFRSNKFAAINELQEFSWVRSAVCVQCREFQSSTVFWEVGVSNWFIQMVLYIRACMPTCEYPSKLFRSLEILPGSTTFDFVLQLFNPASLSANTYFGVYVHQNTWKSVLFTYHKPRGIITWPDCV